MSLHHIYNATTIEHLAARIRQHGMSIAPEIRNAYNDRPEHALDVICEYETHARIVLQSESMSSAWRYLRDAGFARLTRRAAMGRNEPRSNRGRQRAKARGDEDEK